MTPTTLTICAIIAVRDEYQYLKILLPELARQAIDVAIVDNDSTDDSHQLYRQYRHHPVISVDRLPFRGAFSLSDQLEKKHEVCNRLGHDWIVHHDADEILEHRRASRTLRDAIEEADVLGYDIINFEEFVFLPRPGDDHFNRAVHRFEYSDVS